MLHDAEEVHGVDSLLGGGHLAWPHEGFGLCSSFRSTLWFGSWRSPGLRRIGRPSWRIWRGPGVGEEKRKEKQGGSLDMEWEED